MFSRRIAVFVATAAATLATAAAVPVGASALDLAEPVRPSVADGCTYTGEGKAGTSLYNCTFFGSNYRCAVDHAPAGDQVYCKKA
jgi:hypothetical protein